MSSYVSLRGNLYLVNAIYKMLIPLPPLPSKSLFSFIDFVGEISRNECLSTQDRTVI